MNISSATFFSIYSSNKAGLLAAINAHLIGKNVELQAVLGFDQGSGQGKIVAVPQEPTEFKAVINAPDWNSEWKVEEGGCFWVTGEDRAGMLVEILQKIADEKLNLLVVDAVAIDGKFSCYLIASDDDYAAVAQVLGVRSALI